MAGRWDEALYRVKVALHRELVAEAEWLQYEISDMEATRRLPPKDPSKGIQSLPDELLMQIFTDYLSDQYQLEGVCTRWRLIMEATEAMRFRDRWNILDRIPRYLTTGPLRLPGGYCLDKAAMWRGGSAIPRKNRASGIMEYCIQGYIYVRVYQVYASTEIRVFKRRDHLWSRLFLTNRVSVNVDDKGGNVLVMADTALKIMSVHTTDNIEIKLTGPTAVYDGQIYYVDEMATDTAVVHGGPFKRPKRYGPPPNRPGAVKSIVVAEDHVWTIGEFGVAMYDRHTCKCIQHLAYHSYGSLVMAALHRGRLYVARNHAIVHIY